MGFLNFNGQIFNSLTANYQRLAQGETATPTYDGNAKEVGLVEVVKNAVVHSSSRLRAFVCGGMLMMLLIAGWGYGTEEQMTDTVEITSTEPIAQYLHLIVTARESNINTCRLLSSIAANHYPTANMVAYKDYYSKLNESDVTALGQHTLKIRSVLDFLHMFGEDRDEDVVIIPDPEGTVFQLRPDILLERFWEIVRVGQERARLGMSETDANSTYQKIVFGASKTCLADVDDPACYAVPHSLLKTNVYGRQTDRVAVKEEDPNLFVRERFIDSSFVMGELKAVKTLYGKALQIMEADKGKRTEQDAISRIFGEQEYYRASLRDKNATDWDRKRDSIARFFGMDENSPLAAHPTHRKVELQAETEYDYAIGLDYEGLLTASTSNPKVMGFANRNNTSNLSKLRSQYSVSASGNSDLPTDISRSFPPFWSRTPLWDKPRWPTLGWKDIPLFTNLWTGSVPATFNISPTSASSPDEIKQSWQATWFYPYLRRKLNDYVSFPDRQFATLRGGGKQVAYWAQWREKWMLRRSKREHEGEQREDNDEWLGWNDVCGRYFEEILSDGTGGWDTPVHDW